MDRDGESSLYGILVSQSSALLSPSFIEAILSNCDFVGKRGGLGPNDVRNSFNEAYEGDVDLPPDQEHTGCAASPGSLQAG